jgi:voltage-gated sodium channel type II alpha
LAPINAHSFAEAHIGDTDNDLNADDIVADGIGFKDNKSPKDQTQLEVAIGDGMEFTIHGELGLRHKTT